MKKILAAFLVACFLWACDRTSSLHVNDAETSANSGTPMADEFLYGDLIVYAREAEAEIVVAFDGGEHPRQTDGLVDQVFVLQLRDGQQFPDAGLVRNATLHYSGDELSVTSRSDFEMHFQVRDGDANGDVAAGTAYMGYGLARRSGDWDIALDDVFVASPEDVLPTCGPRAPGGDLPENATGGSDFAPFCTSGGEGSVNCSTSCIGEGNSCSVSCGEGFTSCGDSTRCSCKCYASSEFG